MSLTNAFETHTLNYLLNATSVTRPTAWYVGLFTADPTDTGSLSNEISGNSYARRPVAFSVSGAVATNSAAVEFAAATGGSWGTITLATFSAYQLVIWISLRANGFTLNI